MIAGSQFHVSLVSVLSTAQAEDDQTDLRHFNISKWFKNYKTMYVFLGPEFECFM